MEKRVFVSGVNKILTITCTTDNPELKEIRKILESRGIYIVSVSFELLYEENRSIITYRVNVKEHASYMDLFQEIRTLGYIAQIKLIA